MINEVNHAIFKELIERETWGEVAEIHGASEQYDRFSEIYMRHYYTAYPIRSTRHVVNLSGLIRSLGFFHGLRKLLLVNSLSTI